MLVKLDHLPSGRGKNKDIWVATTQLPIENAACPILPEIVRNSSTLQTLTVMF